MRKEKDNTIKKSYNDTIFDIVNTITMVIALIIFAYPVWFVVIASFSDPNAVWNGEVLLWIKGFTFEAYEAVFEYKNIWTGYKNTIIYTVVGTFVNVIMTVCAAYPLSQKEFLPRKFMMYVCMFTMYFGGGLIPTYLVVRNLQLIDTMWAMIIPGAISFYNVLIMKNYFVNSLPHSLQEAATLDGADSFQYLIKIVLPLSKPIIAVVALYYAIGHWNDYYTAMIYINSLEKMPLQNFLRDLLLTSQVDTTNIGALTAAEVEARRMIAQSLKYSSIIVALVPVLVAYPFVQKYFVKGALIGSIKE